MKKGIIAIVIILALASMVKWYTRPDNGIHGIGKNVCLIEGECVMINWDATEVEAEYALQRWMELKKEAKI